MTAPAPRTILVSACLLGLKTRYDGEERGSEIVVSFLRSGRWTPIPVCPEQLGGLPTPRPAAEFKFGSGATILGGKGFVVDRTGTDVTAAFLKGAEQTVAIARLAECSFAILKEKSPSCGTQNIYCNGTLVEAPGITAALLQKNGLAVFSEEDLAAGHTLGQEV